MQRSGWSIKGITCQRAFWDRDGKEPTEYREGDFERIFAEKPSIELHYPDRISLVDLAMLPLIIERLQAEHPDCALHIRSVQDDGSVATVTITVDDHLKRSTESFAIETDIIQREIVDLRDQLREEKDLRRWFQDMYADLYRDVRPLLQGKAMPKQIHFHGSITGPVAVEGTQRIGSNVHAQDNARVHISDTAVYSANDLEAIRRLITDILKRQDELRGSLDVEKITILEGELATLRTELATSAPRHGIVSESLRSLRTVLEGAAGNVLASGWLQVLQGLI
jgi:hypothetical protein